MFIIIKIKIDNIISNIKKYKLLFYISNKQ